MSFDGRADSDARLACERADFTLGFLFQSKSDSEVALSRFFVADSPLAQPTLLCRAYLKKQFQSLCILLGPVMVFAWLASSLLIWGLFPKLKFVSRALLAPPSLTSLRLLSRRSALTQARTPLWILFCSISLKRWSSHRPSRLRTPS